MARQGAEGGHFLRQPDGSPFVGYCWPDAALFTDYARQDARAWWGGLGQRLLAGWQAFTACARDPAKPWLLIEHHRGAEPLAAAYQLVLAGKGDPQIGHMLSLN